MTVKNFIVYKSSAGSGKTFTLVREYLKIVLQNPEFFRHVLAITFTNKAANEMKERVVKYLIALATPLERQANSAIASMLPELVESLKMSDIQIFDRAEKVLRMIMHNYGEFAVSTIDSFTHRVVRTFAHDLNIPMNFEVELDTDIMLEEAVDELISLVGTEPELTRVLIDFVEHKAGDEMNWQIENDLFQFGKTLLEEDSIKHLESLRRHDLRTFMEVRGRLHGWSGKWEEKIRKMAGELLALIGEAGLDMESFFYKDKGVFAFLSRIQLPHSAIEMPKTYARKSLAEGVWLGAKVSPGQQVAFEAVRDRLVPLGNQMVRALDEEFPRYSVYKLLLNNLYATALLGAIEKLLYAACQEDNKLLISEFNRRISAIVREQPAPFIYERLGERYQHYLLDEFQDTSIMQWHNLLPLIENGLASGRMSLVVGDAKQAIYRWRSGDARQFEMLPALIREPEDMLLKSREQILGFHFLEEQLDVNFRSSGVIVEFNNGFFEGIVPALPEGCGHLYASAAQKVAKSDKPGLVRIEMARKDEESGRTYAESVYGKVLEAIAEAREDGYELKDIAILCRENKKAADIAMQLIRNGIEVISTESLLLTQSEHVNFLLSFARHLTSRADPVAIGTVSHYLYRHNYLKEADFIRLWLDQTDGAESPAGEQNELPARFSALLLAALPEFKYPLLKNFDLQGLFRYLAFYFRLDLQQESYLRFFMDYVLDFMRKSHGGIAEFMEWWDEKSEKASLIIPEGIDAVRIMTIHKAKGLQFPVVIYPFADEKFRSTRRNLWVALDDTMAEPLKTAYLPMHKSLEGTVYEPLYREEISRSEIDAVNVLYVALTRPEERLYVITKELPEKTESPVTTPKLLSHYFQSTGIFVKGKESYQFGKRYKKPGTVHPLGSKIEQTTEPFYGKPGLKLMLRKHAPASWEMDAPDKHREWGILVHALMSKVTGPDETDGVIGQMLIEGEITREQAAALKNIAAELFRNPDFAPLFKPGYKALNEVEIITRDGTSYRPDKVLLKDRQAIIIDYKTGGQRDYHREQVLHYARLAEDMGYRVESAFLVYLNIAPELVRVI